MRPAMRRIVALLSFGLALAISSIVISTSSAGRPPVSVPGHPGVSLPGRPSPGRSQASLAPPPGPGAGTLHRPGLPGTRPVTARRHLPTAALWTRHHRVASGPRGMLPQNPRALWVLSIGTLRRRRDESGRDHPTRRRIHAEILAHPGVSVTELRRRFGIGRSTLTYHLRQLEMGCLVWSSRVSGQVRYARVGCGYALPTVAPAKGEREVLAFLASHPDTSAAEVATGLEISTYAAYNRLFRLRCKGRIEGTRNEGRTMYRLRGTGTFSRAAHKAFDPGADIEGTGGDGRSMHPATMQDSVFSAVPGRHDVPIAMGDAHVFGRSPGNGERE